MTRTRSLKKLLFVYQTSFLLLVIITGAIGGLWAYFWQQTSHESVRINALLIEAQLVRGDLYRQLKEITRSGAGGDPNALDQYWHRLYLIDKHFYALQQHAKTAAETRAIESMQQSYNLMQAEMNQFLASPVNEAARIKLLDPAYDRMMLGDFEDAFLEFSKLIAQQRRALEQTIEYWTRLAPILIPAPILLAAALLFFSHRSFRRGFLAPMAEVVSGAKRISEGRLDHRIPTSGVEEVTVLARSINDMASELAASRDALVESEKQAALGALVPVVAHNIRNPLACIRATAQVMDDAEDLRESRQEIIDTVDRLERWIKSLLSYLHPLKPHKTRTTLAAVAEGALAPLKPKLEAKRLSIRRSAWQPDQALYADTDLLEQAIHGLVNNAAEASPPGAQIGLGIESSADEITLIIDDQGPGMPMNPDPKGLAPVPSTKRFGTGLGIPFAFKVSQAHGGRIVFEPAPGGGTRVRLSLPMQASIETESV
ncbi:MAG: HAMP domain-containing histidine kinase [Gammaproteobacteria bacterium]|nr:HAMP domain-containing histidine kinase [Gammaproteobacteria bacterium]